MATSNSNFFDDLESDDNFAVIGETCSEVAYSPYHCSVDGTVRLRGIAGTALLNGYEIFGTLGFAAIAGESAVAPSETDRVVNTGFTVGIGGQRPLSNGNRLRGELIFDKLSARASKPMTSTGYIFSPKYEALTVKFSYLFH